MPDNTDTYSRYLGTVLIPDNWNLELYELQARKFILVLH